MLWKEIEDKAERLGAQRRMVFREEMQKSILTALALKGCFDRIVFQGDTALRLFHGNPRFSEDIDFVLNDMNGLNGLNGLSGLNGLKGLDNVHDNGPGFVLTGFLSGIEQSVRDTFPFIDAVEIRTQKNDPDLQRYVLATRSEDPEHILRTHIELAAIPSYRNRPMILDFPPVHPAVRVEDVDEIVADKLCALALRPYLKGRDLWDIYYLTHERSVTVDWGLVLRKIVDYSEPVSGPEDKLEDTLKQRLEDGLERARVKIGNDGSSILENEMERFLPKHVLESYRTSFDSVLESVLGIIADQNVDAGE